MRSSRNSPRTDSILERVWVEFFDLLCMRLQIQAALRNTTITKDQDDLGPITLPGQPDRVGLVVCLPKNAEEKDIYINGKYMPDVLKSMGFNPTPASYLKPKPPTYDPHYKDSPYPDDYKDLPSDPKCPF
jgi:hypothetical protein